MTILFDCYYEEHSEMNVVLFVEETFWLEYKNLDIDIRSKFEVPNFLEELQSAIYWTPYNCEETIKVLEK